MANNQLVDLTGAKYENFTVIRKGNGRLTTGGQHKTTWICRCICGKEFEVDSQKIRRNKVYSCGCLRNQNRERFFEDLTGKRYGRLTVVRRLKPEEIKHKNTNWLCICDCGNYIHASAGRLNNGTTRSCGCLKNEYKEAIGNLNRKYEHQNKRLYGIYRAMLGRCFNSKGKSYDRYGGRGISVCDEWIGEFGFDRFYEWATQNGYSENLTLDRKDNDKGYCPDNCRWITNLAQQNNKRVNIFVEYDGRKQTLADWARELDVTYSTIYWRYVKKRMAMGEIIAELREKA